jgi:hypothetical protein
MGKVQCNQPLRGTDHQHTASHCDALNRGRRSVRIDGAIVAEARRTQAGLEGQPGLEITQRLTSKVTPSPHGCGD